jgi:hypothetical protein
VTAVAKVVVFKGEPPPDALQTRRAELMAEAAKLNRVAEARASVEARLAELDAEQSALDEGEREAWRIWALNDAEGPPPSPRMQERESIAQRRALLARDLTGALNGQKAIEPQLAALHAELRDIMLKLYERQVDALLEEADELNASVHAAAAAFVAVGEQADGLRDAFVEAQSQAVNGADREREAILRAAFSRIERFEQPSLAGDALERARHASDYASRLR